MTIPLTGSVSAEYYDSHSALPRKGKVMLASGQLMFHPESDASAAEAVPVVVQGDVIRDVKILGDKLHIELDYPGDQARTRLLVLEDLSWRSEIRRIWRSKESRAFSSIVVRFHAMPLLVKLSVVAVSIPFFFMAMMDFLEYVHHFVPLSMDVELGQRVEKQLLAKSGVCKDQELGQAVNKILAHITSGDEQFSYRLHIVKSETANAFALPGGVVVVFSKLLEQSESPEEVAGVLAHEMGHVEQRHQIRAMLKALGLVYFTSMVVGAGLEGVETAETMSEIANMLLYLHYSRDAEEEADQFAAKRLRTVHVKLDGMISFFERQSKKEDKLVEAVAGEATETEAKHSENESANGSISVKRALEWISTHPISSDRVDFLKQEAARSAYQAEAILPSSYNWGSLKKRCKLRTGKEAEAIPK